MTAKDLLKHQFDDSMYQLEQVFAGIDDSLDAKLTEHAYSPRETAAHLAECYAAMYTTCMGGTHEWGTWKPQSTEWPALWTEMKELRARAEAVAIERENWETHALAYGPAHDYYHIGQIAALRLVKDPEWNAYSIYKPE